MSQAGSTPDGAPRSGGGRLRPLDSFDGTLSSRVYASLREAIVSLSFAPGEALRKRDICAALGVSRSPVSEAVARLDAEGLVRVVPQAGTYVARFSMREIREGAFLREALEAAAVEYLAPRLADHQQQELHRNLRVQEALVGDGDYTGFYRLDDEMHRLLMEFTGFPRLHRIARSAWAQVDRARQLVLPHPGRVEATLNEHRRILEALEARDGEAARLAMRLHLRQLLTHIAPLEAARPELFEPS